MRLGPFKVFELETIKELLSSSGIEFGLFIDKDLEKKILDQFHERAQTAPRTTAGSLNLSIVYFDISKEDFIKVKEPLKKYGIEAPSDGAFELDEED